MADRRTNETEALSLLIDAGVVDRKSTLEDLMRLSGRLEELSGGDLGPAGRWQFIVKGKFIWTDDAPSIAAKA